MDVQWCPLPWHNLCEDASQDYVRELGLLYIDCAIVQVRPWCGAALFEGCRRRFVDHPGLHAVLREVCPDGHLLQVGFPVLKLPAEHPSV